MYYNELPAADLICRGRGVACHWQRGLPKQFARQLIKRAELPVTDIPKVPISIT